MKLKFLFPFVLLFISISINAHSLVNFSFFKNKTDDVVKQSIEDYIGMPILGVTGENLAKYMIKQEKQFSSIKNVTIKRMREGEVLQVSIPSDNIFLNNDSVFTEMSEINLRPILTFMRKGLTDLVIEVNTDNTGSARYLQNLSDRRAASIDDWFNVNKIEKSRIKILSMADRNPLYNNDSMLNRKNNRRITFYLIPNKNMIKQAKKGKL